MKNYDTKIKLVQDDEKTWALLERNGWTITSKQPFEIQHVHGSTATGEAANIVVLWLKDEETLRQMYIERY